MSPTPACPDATWFATTGHMYQVIDTPLELLAALENTPTLPACCGVQPHLLTVRSAFEQAFASELLASSGITSDAWIGLLVTGDPSKPYGWINSNEIVTYTSWATGYPDPNLFQCVVMYHSLHLLQILDEATTGRPQYNSQFRSQTFLFDDVRRKRDSDINIINCSMQVIPFR